MSRRPVIFLSVACSVDKDKWRNSICPKLLQIAKEKTTFQKKSGLFVELLPRFELGTSSLPTDWEDEVFCFPVLLCPFQSGVPSFPALLCPLSPLLRFPVWVTVWVRVP